MKSLSKAMALNLFVVAISLTCCGQANCRRTLKVNLYPAIPNAENFYREMESRFETEFDSINLVVAIMPDNTYYDVDGIIAKDADVYEVDCIMLRDFIDAKKIKPIAAISLDETEILSAGKIVIQDNKVYGIPHWLCSNFLFYDKRDAEMQKAKKLSDYQKIFGKDPAINKGLLIDLNGRLTLGELYFDALMDEYKDEGTIIPLTRKTDSKVVDNLRKLPDMTYSTWGRETKLHDKYNFYPTQFIKGHGRAYVGYSESLYSMLYQAANSCAQEDNCLSIDNIAITEWALSEKGSSPVGWVDALCISVGANGQKEKDAITFINFMIRPDIYELALFDNYYVPRYLLPAYRKYYGQESVLKRAPLYKDLLPLAERIKAVTAPDICQPLRNIGKELNTKLLPEPGL